MTYVRPDKHIWVDTDGDGLIEGLSRAASELLGVVTARRQNLFLFFRDNRASVARDAEIARTGWPTGRTVLLEPLTRRPLPVRYTVCLRYGASGTGLHWSFDTHCPGAAAHR
jgi:hypothetical protein